MKTPHEKLIEEKRIEIQSALGEITGDIYHDNPDIQKALTKILHSLTQDLIEEGVRVIGEIANSREAYVCSCLDKDFVVIPLSDAQEALRGLVDKKQK